MCYTATLAKRRIEQDGCGPVNPTDKGTRIEPAQPKAQAQLGLFVASQLGAGRLDAKNGATLLCIPSAVEAP